LDSSEISGTEAGNLAKLMVNRMLKQRLGGGVLAAANRVKIANPPFNSQISRLRGIVLEEIREAKPDIRKIRRFIEGIQARGNARRQFERSTVNEVPLLRWLERLLIYDSEGSWKMADNEWKAWLGLEDIKLDAKIGDVEAEIDDDLRLKYILHFIDLVLAHAAKEREKEN